MSEPLIAFLGDGPRPFALTGPQIVELERLTGSGVGALLSRLASLQFKLADIHETIRLALIGGGSSDEEAHAIVAAYVVGRPLSRTHELAHAILTHLWSGPSQAEPEDLPTFNPPVPPTSEDVQLEPIPDPVPTPDPVALDPFRLGGGDRLADMRAHARRDLDEAGL